MQDLTTGPLTRHLLKTTGFMLVTMVFQTLYFLIDLYWVGRLGTESVAAVGVAGKVESPRARIWYHERDAKLTCNALGACLDDKILLGAGKS